MEEAGEDFMECPEFAAGVYAPGIGQGWEELINVELEITGQFEKVYVSFDLKFLHDAFQREITHVDERGGGRDFGRTPCFFAWLRESTSAWKNATWSAIPPAVSVSIEPSDL